MQVEQASLFHQRGSGTQLVVLSFETEANLPNGYVIYRGGVKAKYGSTNLTTELLIVRKGNSDDAAVNLLEGGKSYNLRPNEAYAVGKVEVVDPDGTLQASNFWFTWDGKRRENTTEIVGQAQDVTLQLASSHILAKEIKITKNDIMLAKVSFWTSNWHTPLYRFDADILTVTLGKKGVANNVRTYLFNVPVPVIPRWSFSLDPRSDGMHIPNLGFRQGAGIGVSWQTNYLVDEYSLVSTAFASYPAVQPNYSISYIRSKISDDRAGPGQFAVTNQFGERFQYSFFGDVNTGSIDNAFQSLRNPKNLFSVTSTFNYETLERVTDRVTNYSLPFEVGIEQGGPAGKWAYQVQAKAARIIEAGDKSATRLTLQAGTFTPLVKLGKITAGTRFDAAARVDARSSGFAGIETGLSIDAGNDLTLSTGAYGYKTFGTPLFAGDSYSTNQGYVLRGDWLGSSTNISLMFRYDPTQGWFDREYRISQVMGPIEPVLVYRQVPRQYAFGIRFRTQDIAKMLQRRSIRHAKDNSEEIP